jgi:hypothetical protein
MHWISVTSVFAVGAMFGLAGVGGSALGSTPTLLSIGAAAPGATRGPVDWALLAALLAGPLLIAGLKVSH